MRKGGKKTLYRLPGILCHTPDFLIFFLLFISFSAKIKTPSPLGRHSVGNNNHKEEEQMKDEEAVRHVDLLMRVGRDPHDSHRQIRIL